MTVFTDHDEYLHYGYPRGDDLQWKENYYFNLIDEPNQVFGICHFSIRRNVGKAVFTFNCLAGGKRIRHINLIDWPPADRALFSESVILSDGCLTLEIVRPFAEHRVTFSKDDINLDVTYTRRFDTYFYDSDDHSSAETDKSLAIEHYEQVMFARGSISVDGESIPIKCAAHRDHSWGYRDESSIHGWNWTSVAFPDSGWNFAQVRKLDRPANAAGFISDASGNRSVQNVAVDEVIANEKGEPDRARYTVHMADGGVLHVQTRCLERMVMPLNREKTTIVFENFSEFLVEETGERGIGIDEHMVNLPDK